MTALRERLPDRRRCDVLNFRHSGIPYTATIGRYGDAEGDRIGELFIDSAKIGSAAAHLAQDVAVLISLAIQHGVPIAVMRAAMGRGDDPVDGEAQPHSVAGAALDILAKLETTTWTA